MRGFGWLQRGFVGAACFARGLIGAVSPALLRGAALGLALAGVAPMASAQIGTVNAWSEVYDSATAPGLSASYPIGAGSSRMLVVAISATTSADDNNPGTIVVSWGGQNLTARQSQNGQRGHAYIYTLGETGIAAGVGNTLVVTIPSLGSHLRSHVFAAVYSNVVQTVADNAGNTDNGPDTTIQGYGSNLTVSAGGLGIEVLSLVSADATAPALTLDADWTAAFAAQTGSGALGYGSYANVTTTTGNLDDPHTVTAPAGGAEHARAGIALDVMIPPTIDSAPTTTFNVGVNGTFTVTATGSPTITYSVSGTLPTGVTFTPATGVLSGTPANGTAGTYPLVFTASNGALPNSTQNFALIVSGAPIITSADNTTFTELVPGSFQVVAGGNPTITYTISGTLPVGVNFDTATGLLSGTPDAGSAPSYALVITASNGVLPNATQNFTLNVSDTTATYGTVYTYENTTSTAINDNNCGAPQDFNFTVADTFNVGGSGTISIGVDLTHANRNHIQLVLVAPNNNVVTLQALNAGGAFADVRAMFTSNADTSNAANDGDADPATAGGAVLYRRLITVANLDTFYSGPANGTWRLRVCDGTSGTTGTFNRARLVLRSTASIPVTQCGTRSAYDWGLNGQEAAFANATVDDVTITQFSTSGEAPGDTRASYITCNADNANGTCAVSRGLHSGYYAFSMNTSGGAVNDTEASAETALFTFSTPVIGLSFAMTDADFSTNNYEDMVRMEATGPDGEQVPYQMLIRGPANNAFAGDWTEADAGVGDASDAGNVEFLFSSPVSSVRVVYAQGNQPATESTTQYIGVTDFSFCAFDYGDAPSSYGTTARHGMGRRTTLFLGANPPDGEITGAPGTGANGDGADEDGISAFPTYVAAGMTCGSYSTTPGEYCVQVSLTNNTTGAAQLVGWLDFNGDGDFSDAGERSLPRLGGGTGGAADNTFTTGNIAASSGAQTRVLVWSGFGSPTNAQTYARIRLTRDASFFSDASPTANGSVVDGETEDYPLGPATTPVTMASFLAEPVSGGRVRVRWSVASETGTLGYYVADRSQSGGLRELNQELVASPVGSSLKPRDYETTLSSASTEFYVIEVDVFGQRTSYGPYRVGQRYGADTAITPIDWAQVKNERSRIDAQTNSVRAGRGSAGLEALVRTTGLQRVPFEAIAQTGLNWQGVPASQVSVRLGSTQIPARVTGGSSLGAGTAIEFLGQAVQNSLYTQERVYRISVDGAPAMPFTQHLATPQVGMIASLGSRKTVLDADRIYNYSSSSGDPWYYDVVTRTGASATGNWTMTIPADADLSVPVGVTVELLGVVDFSGAADDHRYRVKFNGFVIAENSFDGMRTQTDFRHVPAGVAQHGNNTLTLELLATGYAADRLALESATLEYRAPLNAAEALGGLVPSTAAPVPEALYRDAFEDGPPAPIACGAGCQQIRVTGFPNSDIVAVQDTASGVLELTDLRILADGSGFAFEAMPAIGADAGDDGYEGPGGSGLLYAASRSAMPQPALRVAADYAHPLAAGANGQYLAIIPTGFAEEIAPLINARSAQGLGTRVVDLEAIYQHYSAGVVDPEAIRRFLREAYTQMGTRYVLLAGGDTYDYFNRLGLNSVSLIPTFYRKTHEVVYFAPADNVYADVDDDGLPEIAIGRLPARTEAELSAMVAKTLAFDSAPNAHTAVFAAERLQATENVNYSAISDALITLVDPDFAGKVGRVYLDNYPTGAAGVDAARTDLLAAVNAGRAWVSYYGHAATSSWARERLLQPNHLLGLGNSARPAVVTEYGCWGGYFVEPSYNSLGLSWLIPGMNGAAAVLAGSSLTYNESDRRIAAQLVPAVSAPNIRIGDALIFAKTNLWQVAPESVDVITGMTLLGDPALMLNPE